MKKLEPVSIFQIIEDNVIKIFSPAKINLYLDVLGKYKDGYHKIESVMARISLYDEIVIERKDKQGIDIICDDKILENKDNLCYKAALLVSKILRLKTGFSIYLKKRIPYPSGLGSASSNAAYTLLGICKLLHKNLPKEELFMLGQKLGSDVNFFLSESSFAYVYGRGEKVIPLDIKNQYEFIIVYPNIKVPTKLVYQSLQDKKLTIFFNRVNMLIYGLKHYDLEMVQHCLFNRLEPVVISIYKELKKIKRRFYEEGLVPVMTGSGSTFFSLCKKEGEYIDIKAGEEGVLTFRVKTF